MTDRQILITLNMVPKVGAVHTRRLIEAFDGLQGILKASLDDICHVEGFSEPKAARVYDYLRSNRADVEESTAKKWRTNIISWDDPEYPPALRKIPNPPLVLYVTGNLQILREESLGIVGTRNPSTYGQDCARRFAIQFAASGFHVVSGLALGIDTAAHRGALLSKPGRTIAVLGGALDQIFPIEQKPLAREIVQLGGAVITEYPFGRKPDWQTFPMRNRIVSGMVDGLLVVESPLKSGTRITVDYAEQFNKSIFVVPGRIDLPGFKGSHQIIRNGVGRLVLSPMDVVEEYSTLPMDLYETDESQAFGQQEARTPPAGMTPDQVTIWTALPAEGATTDELVALTQLPISTLSAQLIQIQLTRRLVVKPGGVFVRG